MTGRQQEIRPSACKDGHPITWIASQVAWCDTCKQAFWRPDGNPDRLDRMRFPWIAEVVEELQINRAIADLAEQVFGDLDPDDPLLETRPQVRDIVLALSRRRTAA